MIKTFFDEYLSRFDLNLKLLFEKNTVSKIVEFIVFNIESSEIDYFDLTTFARDIYIGSDLSNTQKSDYYSELLKQNFFQKIEHKLYSNRFDERSWTVYTIGKFSKSENADYLVRAFNKYMTDDNFILQGKCLSEIEWLNNVKSDEIIKYLKHNNSSICKLTLLYLYNISSNDLESKKILQTDNFFEKLGLNNGNELELLSEQFFKIEMDINKVNKVEKEDILKIMKSNYPKI